MMISHWTPNRLPCPMELASLLGTVATSWPPVIR